MAAQRQVPPRHLQVTVALALPGLLWAAYEMFGLTLFYESQMLFFSIAHGWLMGLPMWALLVGIPAAGVWWLECTLALMWRGYRNSLQVGSAYVAGTFVALSSYGVLFALYSRWAGTSCRVPMCVFGILVTVALTWVAWSRVFLIGQASRSGG